MIDVKFNLQQYVADFYAERVTGQQAKALLEKFYQVTDLRQARKPETLYHLATTEVLRNCTLQKPECLKKLISCCCLVQLNSLLENWLQRAKKGDPAALSLLVELAGFVTPSTETEIYLCQPGRL